MRCILQSSPRCYTAENNTATASVGQIIKNQRQYRTPGLFRYTHIMAFRVSSQRSVSKKIQIRVREAAQNWRRRWMFQGVCLSCSFREGQPNSASPLTRIKTLDLNLTTEKLHRLRMAHTRAEFQVAYKGACGGIEDSPTNRKITQGKQ